MSSGTGDLAGTTREQLGRSGRFVSALRAIRGGFVAGSAITNKRGAGTVTAVRSQFGSRNSIQSGASGGSRPVCHVSRSPFLKHSRVHSCPRAWTPHPLSPISDSKLFLAMIYTDCRSLRRMEFNNSWDDQNSLGEKEKGLGPGRRKGGLPLSYLELAVF